MAHSRVGETFFTKEGYKIEIIDYKHNRDVTIVFHDEYKHVKKVAYAECKSGKIKNPFHPSVCGVGYYGVGEFKNSQNGKETHIGKVWQGMIRRCYDTKRLSKCPTYKDCTVCEEWHNFQNFAKWYEDNYYEVDGEQMHLDKDILVKGNKVYSPETCCIVPQTINVLFTNNKATRGELPIGVCYIESRNKYMASCSTQDGKKSKLCNTVDEAFIFYKCHKEQEIKRMASAYSDVLQQNVIQAMLSYKVEITD